MFGDWIRYHLGKTERKYLKSNVIEITICFLLEIHFTIFGEKGSLPKIIPWYVNWSWMAATILELTREIVMESHKRETGKLF